MVVKVGVLVKVAALEKMVLATLVTAGILETPAVREAPQAPATVGAAEVTTRALLMVAAIEAPDKALPAAAGAKAPKREDLVVTKVPPAVVGETARALLVAAGEAVTKVPLSVVGETRATPVTTKVPVVRALEAGEAPPRGLATTKETRAPLEAAGEAAARALVAKALLLVRRDPAAAGEATTKALVARAESPRVVDGDLVLENVWSWLTTMNERKCFGAKLNTLL